MKVKTFGHNAKPYTDEVLLATADTSVWVEFIFDHGVLNISQNADGEVEIRANNNTQDLVLKPVASNVVRVRFQDAKR